ncbi:Dna2/Cas4 domain-containing protein [Desulfococcaceae bacterium HSG8]|nr:Dna2/Cas4 domain-containing protein [Desulfococcaceae bacterium HSG8]
MIHNWKHAADFYERVDRLKLHGLHFQHISLCERRAWMYMHNINFAQWYGRVQVGTVKHQISHVRDHSVEGLFGLSPDRIDWKNCIVYENKGTGGAVEASNNQTAFYAVMLSIATGKDWRAVTHVLSTRRNREVLLDDEQMRNLWESSDRLEILAGMKKVPRARCIPLCKTCSLSGFCGHN